MSVRVVPEHPGRVVLRQVEAVLEALPRVDTDEGVVPVVPRGDHEAMGVQVGRRIELVAQEHLDAVPGTHPPGLPRDSAVVSQNPGSTPRNGRLPTGRGKLHPQEPVLAAHHLRLQQRHRSTCPWPGRGRPPRKASTGQTHPTGDHTQRPQRPEPQRLAAGDRFHRSALRAFEAPTPLVVLRGVDLSPGVPLIQDLQRATAPSRRRVALLTAPTPEQKPDQHHRQHQDTDHEQDEEQPAPAHAHAHAPRSHLMPTHAGPLVVGVVVLGRALRSSPRAPQRVSNNCSISAISRSWSSMIFWASSSACGFSPPSRPAWAMSTAPRWWAIISSRNRRSNSAPDSDSSSAMASSWLIPSMSMPPWSMPSMPPVGEVSSPQASSQEVIFSISGPWAAEIRSARERTSSLSAFSTARSAISMAPSWWTIIIWANIVSAPLCPSSAAGGEVLSVVPSPAVPAAGSSGAGSPLPHAARERVSAIPPATAASRVLSVTDDLHLLSRSTGKHRAPVGVAGPRLWGLREANHAHPGGTKRWEHRTANLRRVFTTPPDGSAAATSTRPRAARSGPVRSAANQPGDGVGGFLQLRLLLLTAHPGGLHQAVSHVLIEQPQREGLQRAGGGRDLGEDVDAVLVLLHHLGDAPDLPLDAAQPHQVVLLLRGVPVHHLRHHFSTSECPNTHIIPGRGMGGWVVPAARKGSRPWQ